MPVRTIAHNLLLATLAVLCTIFLPLAVDATTWVVPDEIGTIEQALAGAGTGDTVLVRPGDYEVAAVFNGRRVILRSSHGAAVTVLRPRAQLSPILSLVNREPIDTEISGFTFTGYDSVFSPDIRSIIRIDQFARPRIQNCIFRDNYNIRCIDAISVLITIKRNLFYNCTGDFCISIWKGSASILNNTIANCTNGVTSMAAEIEVVNNIIVNCTQYGVKGVIYGFDYNNVWNNTSNYGDGSIPGLHDISTDPQFVHPEGNDYHLLPASPCRDAGHPDPVFNDPDGTRADMGAYPVAATTDINGPIFGLPDYFELAQNYPNPFNGQTVIAFRQPLAAEVTVDVLDNLGRQVRQVNRSWMSAGEHRLIWDGTDDFGRSVSSGVYFYRVRIDGRAQVRKMVLLK